MRASIHYESPSHVRCIRFETVAPGRPYHAALSATEATSARGLRFAEHEHDYYEMMFVLAGEAIHGLNGQPAPLVAGDLILLRPVDRHYVRFQTGRRLHYINIAIVADLWQDFHDLAEIQTGLKEPVVISTFGSAAANDDMTKECAAAFRRALLCFQVEENTNSAMRTEVFRLLATVAPWLLTGGQHEHATEETALLDAAPSWLIRAIQRLKRDPEALRNGLPAFVDEAGVTGTHLARVLKATMNQTPTEFVNRLRLESAARLLTTTPLSILDIAAECGFEQPSYFYRVFHARFQTSPHAYRIAATRRVAPKHGSHTKTPG